MNIDRLKSIIQAINDDIMELKFGCEVEIENQRAIFLGKDLKGGWKYACWRKAGYSFGSNYYDKILGRPIRLADVLYAMKKVNPAKYVHITRLGEFYDGDNNRIGFWNLKDDNLDHQSDETKQFLIDLLIQPS